LVAGAAIRAGAALLATAALTAAPVGAPVDARTIGPHPGAMYVLGDSWSAGAYADPAHTLAQDAADDLGMPSIVDAQSGTGYLSAPPGTESYPERATAVSIDTPVRVVVIQGGSNDVDDDIRALPKAVGDTIAAVRRALPHAQVVLLGPGPDPWPVTASQRAVDAVLEKEADRAGAPYISPLREGWFTGANVGSIIDPGTEHPTVHGDELLGRRLAADLRRLLPEDTVTPDPAVPGR
jgi:hypothetical protein